VGVIEKIAGHLLLAGLLTIGLACGQRPLPRAADNADAGTSSAEAGTEDGTDNGYGEWQSFPELTNDYSLDLLFVIDNSPGMAPLQQKLLTNFPVFMNVLKALPDGLPDLHLAVISTDTGPGRFDLPEVNCRYRGDQGAFQTQPRGTCATSPLLDDGQSFLQTSNDQAEKNYTGDITDAFACIAALGEGGCGFESPLKSLRWALDPQSMPAGNRGFLREDAYLGVILVTHQDDCSVPDDSDLIDPTQIHMSDRYGPFSSFRCNEFGHLCDIGGVWQHPARGPNSDLTGCISDDTATGRETRVADEIAFLKGLKSDPSRISVSVITGPTAPYDVAMKDVTLADGSVELQPYTLHSCMPFAGEYADPAVRLQQWATAFGSNGLLLPICSPTFAPAFTPIADVVGEEEIPPISCVTGPFVFSGADQQPDCQVVERDLSPDSERPPIPIPNCFASSPLAPPCWTLELPDIPQTCPDGSLQFSVSTPGLPPSVPLRDQTAIRCRLPTP
jgi:hypothetical protein